MKRFMVGLVVAAYLVLLASSVAMALNRSACEAHCGTGPQLSPCCAVQPVLPSPTEVDAPQSAATLTVVVEDAAPQSAPVLASDDAQLPPRDGPGLDPGTSLRAPPFSSR